MPNEFFDHNDNVVFQIRNANSKTNKNLTLETKVSHEIGWHSGIKLSLDDRAAVEATREI